MSPLGLLNNHLGDLDGFLPEFIAEGARQAVEAVGRLRTQRGAAARQAVEAVGRLRTQRGAAGQRTVARW
ncbi:hypothetical protein AB0I81_09145 [Nonomuraea sp. NPDC050404]|uniref:hypothetical protein n=1 Tax=Nonomuraea sp. NPDC050404 TaxID=3155783 RepID=UPI0033EA7042